MSKTIEEAAKQFAEMKTTKQAGSFVERDKKALLMTQFFQYALEELPLSSRLTEEEKEKIQEQYDEVRIFTENIDPCGETSEYYLGQKVILERIFGKELFERKEE